MRWTFWVVLLSGVFSGLACGLALGRHPACPDLREELHAVEERCAQLAATRCMNVTTPVLNISVYDTPNLGRK